MRSHCGCSPLSPYFYCSRPCPLARNLTTTMTGWQVCPGLAHNPTALLSAAELMQIFSRHLNQGPGQLQSRPATGVGPPAVLPPSCCTHQPDRGRPTWTPLCTDCLHASSGVELPGRPRALDHERHPLQHTALLQHQRIVRLEQCSGGSGRAGSLSSHRRPGS